MVCKLGCIRKGPKPLSPDPETIDILSMIPQKFEMDSNVFDSDRITNITPLHFMMQSEIDRRMKRKLTFNHMNDNTLIHTTKRKRLNQRTQSCSCRLRKGHKNEKYDRSSYFY
ncbi:unnamed protein product [Parnassius apollo]|uniref:(apollo) hypothetical protein n=1 Tax=Parnassius apollo TaxID=110799 RepID=A0A8S3WSN6_PARAO|nr:unnamed protein product [Parnassius apollo]